jgi:LPS export ABC transporter protein LptC
VWRILHRVPWLLIAIVTLSGCVEIDSEGDLAEDEVRWGLPSQEFEDVSLTHSQAGDKLFHLTAPHLDRYDRKERAFFYGGIEIYFYEDGEVSSRLTSESGEVLRDGEELVAIGNVIVTTDTGTTILTPRLRWERDTKLITNDTTVTIITDYDTLHGTGLIATDDLKMKRIINPTGISHRNSAEDGEGGGGMLLSPGRSDSGDPEDQQASSTSEKRRSASMTVVGPSGNDPTNLAEISPFEQTADSLVADSVLVDSTASDPEPEGDE